MAMVHPGRVAAIGVALTAVLVMVAAGAEPASNGTPTSDAAWKRLREGNARFVSDMPAPRDISRQRRATLARGQRPFAAVLTCADSRVAPELVFDQGLGELFVLRMAGNVADAGVIGSIEYAVEHFRCPLVVVLGHESCGAVQAAVEHADVHGNLGTLIEQVHVGTKLPDDPKAALAAAVRNNVLYHASELTYKSTVLKDFASSGRIRIVPGVYSLTTGEVSWLDLPKRNGKVGERRD
jgi:carbonic anhydrase